MSNLVRTQLRLRLQREAMRLGKYVGGELRAGVGFALLIFDYGENGSLAYISSAEREDIVKLMVEFIARNGEDGFMQILQVVIKQDEAIKLMLSVTNDPELTEKIAAAIPESVVNMAKDVIDARARQDAHG